MAKTYSPYAVTNLAAGTSMPKVMRELGGNVEIEVNNGIKLVASQFSMTYGVNSIPTATALIALGRNVRTGEQADVHDPGVIKQLKLFAAVTVMLTGRLGDWSPSPGEDDNKKQWPRGRHVLFTGYVSGVSYRRSVGRVSLVVNMVSVLVGLSQSSVGSGDVVPGAINDLLLPETFRGAGGEIASNAGGKFIGQLPDDISIDFSEGLLKVIKYICEENQLQTHDQWCGTNQGPAAASTANTAALLALEGGTNLWRGVRNLIGTNEYVDKYPLNIHSKGKPYVSDWVGRRVAHSLAGDTIWSLLIGSLLPSFGLYVIPTAREAYVAPCLPMGNKPGKSIYASEYVDFNFSAMSQQPLYGVGIMSNYNLATINGGSPKICVGASYTPYPEGSGRWLFTNAPGWMDGWVNYDPDTVQGEPDVVKMLNKPTTDVLGNGGTNINRDVSQEAEDWNLSMSRYAQMLYASNSLRGRDGYLVGKLRFDISPGTILFVQGKSGISGYDDLATNLIGFVSSVTISINSEQASATTAFNMTNLRTDVENTEPGTSMSDHPFFPKYFTYAPLVETLKIDD